jgi:hypothetical protein
MEIRSQFFTYGEEPENRLVLHNGETFGPVTLAYETYGILNEQKDNAVLIFHALSGSQHVAGFNPEVPGVSERWNDACKQGWWDDFVGPGKPIDTDRWHVVCFNALLMKFAKAQGASMIVRGLRAVADFEYEYQMAGMNQQLNRSVETVFLMADVALQPIASRLHQPRNRKTVRRRLPARQLWRHCRFPAPAL